METTASRPSRGSRALDSDRVTSLPSTASYIRARAERADLSQDDPVPLFLSDPLGEPDPREFAPRALRPSIVPRLIAAVLAVAILAILGALFQSDLRNLVAANAGGAVATPGQPAAQAGPQIAQKGPLKDPARVTNTMLASADAQNLPTPSAPSREAIASAYQIALQAQAPGPVAAPPAPPQPPAKTLDADTLAGLMTRAKGLIGVGDIAAARLLLERAANANDATAALLLAQTYDPTVLGTRDIRSVSADASAARDWYQKAMALGSTEAKQRLAQLSN
ncbi:hypothetical protein [Bradyrhizobium commune]|uniref:Sel1 repeat family protein n=1 Tax=Bradyrhizobium commune TaxID=83627 RepID=A0A7S9D6B6_9BRAD|nr:hypothetical protein [Bradyrhizobium commune]QPF92012.1 hypothetical protein IC761_01530 [Bradyrhizobium commune]